jgi:phage-related protein (TIGR01555 family)
MPKKKFSYGVKGPDGHIRFPRLQAVADASSRITKPKPGMFGLNTESNRNPQHRKANRSIANDYFSNMLARMGYGTPSLPEATDYEMVRLSNNYWLMLTLYRNHWIARRIVDLPAQDMTRAWPKLTCDLSPDDISKFDRTVMRTYTALQVRKAIKWARLYGGAGALIAIKGHELFLEEPLDLDDVNPGSYLGLIPFDRWVGIVPTGAVDDDYRRPQDWGLPEFYTCTAPDTAESFRIHSSRILRFTGPEVPTPEMQAQIYWGISELEVCWEELRKRDNASFAILNLLFRANIIARIEPDLAQILSGLGMSQNALKQWSARMQAQNELMSSQSMMVLGKDAHMESVSYSFAGMGEVYAQFQMDVAGAAEIPVTRLFGKTVTGLGQSNDADERYYEEKIAQNQNSDLRPQLDKLYPVICMSEFGEVPDDLDFKFPSVRVMTEEEKADLVEKASAPILAAYNSGVISQQTAMKELKELSDQTGIFTNITDDDIESAETELMIPGEQGMEGMEGGEGEEGEPAKGGPEEKAGGKALPNPQRLLKKASAGAEDSAIDDKRIWRAIKMLGKASDAAVKEQEKPEPKKIKWRSLDVNIENPVGSVRSGRHQNGKPWQVTMTRPYGEIVGTLGVDKDALDVFMGPDPTADSVHIITTMKSPDFLETDEQKCFLDFKSAAAAKKAFFDNFDSPEHFGSMITLDVDTFIKKALATKKNPKLITKGTK